MPDERSICIDSMLEWYAAEAMIMMYNLRSRDQKKEGSSKFFVSNLCYPQTIDVLKTRCEPLNIELVIE